MRALKPRVKIFGLAAVLLAGVALAGADEAAARSMGGTHGNIGAGNGRPPAFHNTIHPIISRPGSGTSKPGKTSGKHDKSSGRDHDRDKGHVEVRVHGPSGSPTGTPTVVVRDHGPSGSSTGAPTVEVRDHGASGSPTGGPTVIVRDHGNDTSRGATGESINSRTATAVTSKTIKGLVANGPRDHRRKALKLTPSDVEKLNNIGGRIIGGAL
jgi:hypothetical protein